MPAIERPEPAVLLRGVTDERRLAAVAELGLTGHLGDRDLDAVVGTVAAALDVPMAVVNIVTPGRQTYPAEVGVGSPCTTVPDQVSFCAAVVDSGLPLSVADAATDPVWSQNPLVQAGIIGAYAGHPLVHDGVVLGAVSAFDRRARTFTDPELRVLALQARLAGSVLALRWAATHDPLTGLANRARATDVGLNALGDGQPLSVLFVDVDEFKAVNDRHGHDVGDGVLEALARHLERSVAGTGGLVARWGGDEFLVVLPGAGAPAAWRVGRRITDTLAPFGPDRLAVTVTVGVATAEQRCRWAELVRWASDAAAVGKRNGKRNVTEHVAAMGVRSVGLRPVAV
jgi:diguanylate cyclase (GGDEF)-like protein